jgi:hypothetical protein
MSQPTAFTLRASRPGGGLLLALAFLALDPTEAPGQPPALRLTLERRPRQGLT